LARAKFLPLKSQRRLTLFVPPCFGKAKTLGGTAAPQPPSFRRRGCGEGGHPILLSARAGHHLPHQTRTLTGSIRRWTRAALVCRINSDPLEPDRRAKQRTSRHSAMARLLKRSRA